MRIVHAHCLAVLVIASLVGCASEEAKSSSSPLRAAQRWTRSVRQIRIDVSTVQIWLPGDEVFVAHRTRVVQRVPSRFSWYGELEGTEGQLTLTRHEDALIGVLRSGATVFRLSPTTDDRLRFVLEEEPAQPELEPIDEDEENGEESNLRAGLPGDELFGASIGVMVAYTRDAMHEAAPWWDEEDRHYILAEIEQAIDESNSIFARSGIMHRLELRVATLIDHEEFEDVREELDWFRREVTSSTTTLGAIRDRYAPDINSLWVAEGGSACGRGYIMTRFSQEFAPRAMNVVDRGCNGRWTFTHEVGHNLGAAHDRYVSPGDVSYPYAHGYTDLDSNQYTVMSYDDDCREHTPWYEELYDPCRRVPIFSGPNNVWEDAVMGTDEHEDNARVIQLAGVTASTFSDWPGWSL